jgi:hypothetical protein
MSPAGGSGADRGPFRGDLAAPRLSPHVPPSAAALWGLCEGTSQSLTLVRNIRLPRYPYSRVPCHHDTQGQGSPSARTR